jgi:hypothetical protein
MEWHDMVSLVQPRRCLSLAEGCFCDARIHAITGSGFSAPDAAVIYMVFPFAPETLQESAEMFRVRGPGELCFLVGIATRAPQVKSARCLPCCLSRMAGAVADEPDASSAAESARATEATTSRAASASRPRFKVHSNSSKGKKGVAPNGRRARALMASYQRDE